MPLLFNQAATNRYGACPQGSSHALSRRAAQRTRSRRATQLRMGALQNPATLTKGEGEYKQVSTARWVHILIYINISIFIHVFEGRWRYANSCSLVTGAHKSTQQGQCCTLIICLGMAGGADNFHLEPTLATRGKMKCQLHAHI